MEVAGSTNECLNLQEMKMNKKLIFGLALLVVFVSGTFYSAQAARYMEREAFSLMTPDVRDYYITLSPRDKEEFLALEPWQWEYIVSLDNEDRYAFFVLEPQERIVFFSLQPDFRIGFLGLVPEERHVFITLRPEERGNFFSQRHDERAMSGPGKSRVQREPAVKGQKELSGRSQEKGFSDTGRNLKPGEKPEKGALGNGNNQGRTGAETNVKQQAPAKSEADRGAAISPRQENRTGADTRMKQQAPAKPEADRGAAMSPRHEGKTGADTHKSEPAAEVNSGKGTHEKAQ
jgi:hypothetical protein